MELIDTHAHLTFPELEQDIEAVVRRSKAAGVTGWITVGTDVEQIEKVLTVVRRFDNMYAAVGFHPHYANDISDDKLQFLRAAAGKDKVVAIGETGLDYHYNFSKQVAQKKLFTEQLTLAAQAGLPVIVHCRNAFDDVMAILNEFAGRLKNVVVHCFSGTVKQAELVLERGYYVSFTGIVTFKKSDEVRAAAKLVPLDRLMVETDCPYISPEPVRNKRPCEPAFMVHTARKLAQLKGMDLDDLARQITATSKRFFGLD